MIKKIALFSLSALLISNYANAANESYIRKQLANEEAKLEQLKIQNNNFKEAESLSYKVIIKDVKFFEDPSKPGKLKINYKVVNMTPYVIENFTTELILTTPTVSGTKHNDFGEDLKLNEERGLESPVYYVINTDNLKNNNISVKTDVDSIRFTKDGKVYRVKNHSAYNKGANEIFIANSERRIETLKQDLKNSQGGK